MLLFLQLLDLLFHSVVSELGQEHFLLLIDKLADVLGAMLLRELDSTTCDVHGLVDVVLLS